MTIELAPLTQEQRDQKLYNAVKKLRCLCNVEDMIQDGMAMKDIAEYIQGRGEMTIYENRSIQRALKIYVEKNKLKYPIQHAKNRRKAVHNPLDKNYIDPLDTYQLLETMQMERIMLNFGKEIENNETYKETDDQIKIMNHILKNHASIETDRTIRYMHRNPDKNPEEIPDRLQTVRERIQKTYGEKVSNVISDPESRRRLMNVLEMVKNKHSNEEAKKIIEGKLDRIKAMDAMMSSDGSEDDGEIIDV